MYGPYSAPGMRTRQSSMFKPKKPSRMDRRQLWQPAGSDDGDDDGQDDDGTPKKAQELAIASNVLPTILHLIPRLKLSNPPDAVLAAAQELVQVSNTTTSGEDDLVGETGLIEAVVTLLIKSPSPQCKTHAASAIANLTSKSQLNKVRVARMGGCIVALVSLAEATSDKERCAASRALASISALRESAEAMLKAEGCVEALASLILTGSMNAKEDGCKALDLLLAHGTHIAVDVAGREGVLQALKSSARSINCSLRARAHSISALHTMSRNPKLRGTLLRTKICSDVFVPVLEDGESLSRHASQMNLLATMGACQLSLGPDDDSLVPLSHHVAALVPALAATVHPDAGMGRVARQPEPRLSRRSMHLLSALSLAARNDALKAPILESRALELCMDLVAVAHKANQRGQALREITLFILALSTDASVQQRMIRLDYMAMLSAHVKGPDATIRRWVKCTPCFEKHSLYSLVNIFWNCSAALWSLGQRQQQQQQEKGGGGGGAAAELPPSDKHAHQQGGGVNAHASSAASTASSMSLTPGPPASRDGSNDTRAGKQQIFMLHHGDDEVRVSRVACALSKKGYNVSPQWLVNGHSAGRDGKGKERGLGSRPRLSPDLREVSCALSASSVVCLCISSSFVGCTVCRIASAAVEEENAPAIPLLFDHTKPSRSLHPIAPLLACIDFIDSDSFGLAMMELTEELSSYIDEEQHSFDASGFGATATPPTIAFTNLTGAVSASPAEAGSDSRFPPSPSIGSMAAGSTGSGFARPLTPRSSSHGSTAHSWDGYDASFMLGGTSNNISNDSSVYEASVASSWVPTRSTLWKAPDDDDDDDDDDEEGGEDEESWEHGEDGETDSDSESGGLQNLPLDRVASIISAEVSKLTAPLEAKVTELEARLASRRALLAELEREAMY